MKKVLVAEDEESIREFIVINLTRSGYNVEQAENGAVALEKFSQDENGFDVAILDIMMPELDGLSVCKELRKRSSDLGIIMLSAKTQEMDKVTGLMYGADDYVTKPFSPSELMARVDAVYRRVEMTRGFRKNDTTGDSIVLDEFELNLRNRTLSKNGEMIELTQVEFQIIEYFFKNPNAALSRTDILKTVWPVPSARFPPLLPGCCSSARPTSSGSPLSGSRSRPPALPSARSAFPSSRSPDGRSPPGADSACRSAASLCTCRSGSPEGISAAAFHTSQPSVPPARSDPADNTRPPCDRSLPYSALPSVVAVLFTSYRLSAGTSNVRF